MAAPVRLRLYQYPQSPFCIAIELLLRHSGIPYETVDFSYGDPSRVIQLTKGEYYQVPVVEDLFSHQVVFDNGPDGDEVARYIDNLAPLLQLFPESAAGWQRILVTYIENECENIGFKVNDAFRDRWLKGDLERGLHRRHKERKFGASCLEDWSRNVNSLIQQFGRLIFPFEQILAHSPFLTGARPVFADYALCGVIGNFLFAGMTTLPENCLMLEAWYSRMRAGSFGQSMGDMHVGDDGTNSETIDPALFADVADMEKEVTDLKVRPGTSVLDVGTGHGHVALALAAKGCTVTACDTEVGPMQEAARMAKERNLPIAFHEHPPEQLPYPDGSFGLVTCRMAAHHFKAPETFIRETMRVLKTYGYLVLIDSTVPDDHVEAHAWMNSVERLRDPEHIKFITPNVWRKWCLEAGLTVTRLQVETARQPDLNSYFNETQTPAEIERRFLRWSPRHPRRCGSCLRLAGRWENRLVPASNDSGRR